MDMNRMNWSNGGQIPMNIGLGWERSHCALLGNGGVVSLWGSSQLDQTLSWV